MRVNTDRTFVNRTGDNTQSVRMSFDENSLGFLMDVMTNLYSDTAMAPIREYSSNALDSHRDAGVTRPIEVRLPTNWNRVFEVQDFGLGMSPDDITKIYSKYGYSTKRDSDEVVGMLGLGSKSGLTYADQFTVVAIKGGVKTLATVARGTDGAGTINILDTFATDEGNGVTIQIPVHDVDTFRRKASEFFRWWEPGTVLINGEPPVYPDTDTLELSDDIIIHKNNSINEDYVVMGCVAYPVGLRLSMGLPYGYHVVAYVPMGAVNFPPNREGLQYTRRTDTVIADINDRRKAGIKAAAEADIQNAKTYSDAIRAKVTWRGLLGSDTPQYKGQDIPTYIGPKSTSSGLLPTFFYFDDTRYRGKLNTLTRIEAEQFVKTLFITDFTNQTLSTDNRRKIKVYLDQQGLDYSKYIAHDELFGGPWNDGVETVSWNDIKKIRLSSSGTSGRKRGQPLFDIYDAVNGTDSVEEVEADDIVLVSPTWLNTRLRNYVRLDTISDALPGSTLVVLGQNRWEKFQRDNDNVRTVNDALQARVAEFAAELTDYEYLSVSGSGYSYDGFRQLDKELIEDPEVVNLIEQMQDAQAGRRLQQWNVIRTVGRVTAERYFTLPNRTVEFEEVLDKYPFVQYAGRVATQHTIDYINLVYREGKDNK